MAIANALYFKSKKKKCFIRSFSRFVDTTEEKKKCIFFLSESLSHLLSFFLPSDEYRKPTLFLLGRGIVVGSTENQKEKRKKKKEKRGQQCSSVYHLVSNSISVTHPLSLGRGIVDLLIVDSTKN